LLHVAFCKLVPRSFLEDRAESVHRVHLLNPSASKTVNEPEFGRFDRFHRRARKCVVGNGCDLADRFGDCFGVFYGEQGGFAAVSSDVGGGFC
jgi:hypothetical protein